MNTKLRTWMVSTVTVAALALLTACGTSAETENGPEPAIGAVPQDVDLRTLTMPLDAFMYTPEQIKVIDSAVTALAVRCLQRFGFTVVAPVPVQPLHQGHEGSYGLVDINSAEKFGYHADPARMAARHKEPPMDPPAYAVMHGEVSSSAGHEVPSGGCLGEARRNLGAVDQNKTAKAIALANQSAARAKSDGRILAAFTQWSQCMQRNGHKYDDPWLANDDPRWQQADHATPEEIQAAVADARCKAETRLVPIWVAVETAYQLRAMEQNATALNELKTLLDNELRNANNALAATR